jgi:uncharacterized protein
MTPVTFNAHIHLLYVPTLSCNLACNYCYLGDLPHTAALKKDSRRAAATLRQALDAFLSAGVLPFNVSLHGGEPTTLPPDVLEELFTIIRQHYRDHFDELTARGFKKSYPHVKTNLFNFHKQYNLFDRHKVSISASIDLPLSLHSKYRTTKNGKPWLKQTLENLRLLAGYPHAAKISSTLYREHLEDIPALIADIWRIHREIGFDMNNFNFMFGFENALSRDTDQLQQVPDNMQARFYEAMRDEFTGTELEEGFRNNWFDEFKPTYCTNSFNCGERFLLLQSDGEVYSCVRGQGLNECHYGNILLDPLQSILTAGRSKIALLHQQAGLDVECRTCEYLHICHTGCPVVKRHSQNGRSYTCALQKALYRDNPRSCPPAQGAETQGALARAYITGMHPALAFDAAEHTVKQEVSQIILPDDLTEDKNALLRQIETDSILGELYSDQSVILEINGDQQPLCSQTIKGRRDLFSICDNDRIALHIKRSFFEANCQELVRNTLHLQMLRDTKVVYGDEQRSKQEHLFTHQIFYVHLRPSHLFDDCVMAELGALLSLHREMFLKGVLNNLFVTTGYLREYHYQKQKANAFYHIQAINLPFQNFEFYWD